MPRGVRTKMTAEKIQEQLSVLESKKQKHLDSAKSIEVKIKALKVKAEGSKIDELAGMLRKSGKTVEEIKATLGL